MDKVFGGCAQGAEKFIPVADHPNPTIDHETYVPSPPTNFPIGDSTCMFNNMDEVGSNVGNEWDAMWREASPTSSNLQDTLNDISDKGRGKRVMKSGSSQSNKKAKTESTKKTRGSVALCEKIDGMVQLVSERNNSTKEFQVAMANMMNSMNISAPKYLVTDAMLKLCSMGDLDSNSPEFYYACTLIEDPQRRTILLEFPDDKKRVDYIRFMYAQHMGGMDYNTQMKMLLLLSDYMDGDDNLWDLIAWQMWMNEILNGHETRCFNALRMYPSLFVQLCTDLENRYGLRSSVRMSIIEKVGIFVYVLAHGAPNKATQERFQHSGEIVIRVFKEVLYAMDGLSRDIIVPRDPDFKEIPQQLANDTRYMPYFKVVTIFY
ncbi:hypothetical protein RDABS01_018249 [Bienertia sinuspersici]